jgi:3'(2'), 5'-bisphosphate nucleotidase
MTTLPEDLLPKLVDLAIQAGEKIMEVYGTAFSVNVKDDASPCTAADLAAEAIILAGLEKSFPDIAVVSEEAASEGRVPEATRKFFLVDPLDGTKEFVSRNGEFTVNIALIDDEAPVAGVVYAPAMGTIWWGAHGQGSWHGAVVEGQVLEARSISVRPSPQNLSAVGSRSHGTDAVDERLAHFAIGDTLSVGSSLKFCLVAEGRADIYPRLGRTMEWDTAAGDAILRAAGGRVETLDGHPLPYGKRNQATDADFANPHFVAFGCKSLLLVS